MPAVLIWALVAGATGVGVGFALSSKSSNLAVMFASTAIILYLIQGRK
jgi:hypothetical protein